jgi:hypothetical protein
MKWQEIQFQIQIVFSDSILKNSPLSLQITELNGESPNKTRILSDQNENVRFSSTFFMLSFVMGGFVCNSHAKNPSRDRKKMKIPIQ